MTRRAFTLVELLVVIAIIGLLSTVAVVQLSDSRNKGRVAAGQESDHSIYQAIGDNVIADWHLDETSGTAIADSSGNGNNGTMSSAINGAMTTAGVYGNALNFSGNHIETTNQITVAHDSFTATLWFKSTATGYQWIMTSDVGKFIGTGADGQLRACLVTCPQGTARYNDGNWHFAAVTGDATAIRGYVDGNLQFTAAPDSSSSTATILIGMAVDLYPFTGTLDQVRLYSGSLTAQAIQKYYAEGRSIYPLARAEK
jgi:prepilin-type N-terminal cleavage/methylation domain-containing protein